MEESIPRADNGLNKRFGGFLRARLDRFSTGIFGAFPGPLHQPVLILSTFWFGGR